MILTLATGCGMIEAPWARSRAVRATRVTVPAVPPPPPAPRVSPVTPEHWRYCGWLCRGKKRLVSVGAEVGSPYVNCFCEDGGHFRVARIGGARKKGK